MFNYLFISTKWFSKDGGIQTINRELCKQLSKNNNIYVLLTDGITTAEMEDANSYNVQLIEKKELNNILITKEIDFICTHASFTGAYIQKIKEELKEEENLPKFIHFIHHDPEEIENYKELAQDKQVTRNYKKDIEVAFAAKADGVMAIGRKLREVYKGDITTENPSLEDKIKYINCGISKDYEQRYLHTSAPKILLSGRTSSLTVKGIDLFSKAVGKLKVRTYNPSYIIRGEDGDLDSFHEHLVNEYNAPRKINIKPYTTENNVLLKDKLKATLSVLPSKEDGFGLSAAETISLNIPTIVSSNSGIGELIESLNLEPVIKKYFIWTVNDNEENISKLRSKIKKCIQNQEASYEATTKLREALYKVSSWEGASQKFIEFCENLLGIELMKDKKEEISLFMKRKNPYLKLYDQAFEQSKEHIDILSIKLKKLRIQQGDFLINKAKEANIRIALLDPCFPIPDENKSIASIRESEENMDAGSIRLEIVAWYEDVWVPYSKKDKKEWSGSLDIRLFRALPTVNMTRTDDKMFIGTFLLNRDDISPTFIVSHEKNSSMGYKIFQAYTEHFDIIWKNARSFNDISEEIKSWKE